MRVVMFYHSLVSCWNHGNAHFLRGVASELLHRGHEVAIYEPKGAWSAINLASDYGVEATIAYRRAYPHLDSTRYELDRLDLDQALDGADLVLVHEWNDPALVARLGRYRARARDFRLLFHDTHHRAVSDPAAMAAYDLRDYDGVLAFGSVLRELYLELGWTQRAWTWHEAADTRVFRPMGGLPRIGDLVWVGNWGDDERTAELREFLLEPARALGLRARVYGVRYPAAAKQALREAGIQYGGYLPNHEVPLAFARHRFTVHVPRRPYVRALPGIPTIRPFEALACGIPLVSSPWPDIDGLFCPGDFLVARDGAEMTAHMRALSTDDDLASELSRRGRRRILAHHTCGHRVDELFAIRSELGRHLDAPPPMTSVQP